MLPAYRRPAESRALVDGSPVWRWDVGVWLRGSWWPLSLFLLRGGRVQRQCFERSCSCLIVAFARLSRAAGGAVVRWREGS